MSIYRLRPHHGLCLHFFRGNGYSEDFVENMTEISLKLGENPTIELVSGSDQVCEACPNRVGETGCASDEKVLSYDASVLKLCGLNVGDQLHWQDFLTLVNAHILEPGLLESVCTGCQWISICKGLQA